MARNPDYQFVSMDTSELMAEMVTAYERLTGVTVRPASPERLFIQWVAGIVLQERALTNRTGNQNIPSRATGENLDALGQMLYNGVERPAAQSAACTVRFFISAAQSSAVLIPQGTRVTDRERTTVWETQEDAYVPIGDTSLDLTVRCQVPGSAGNGFVAGQIDTLVDLYDYASGCRNLTESGGGSDEATDDEYYELLRDSMDAWSTAGARGAYRYHAKRASMDIGDVLPVRPEAGKVEIYVLMKDGTPANTETKAAVLAACSDDMVRPLTDYVSVEDPDEVSYNITLTYYILRDTSRSAADIQAETAQAVEDYAAWQSARLGRDINPSELIRRIMSVEGIKRVALTAPAFRALADGSDGVTPELAVLGTVTVTNGGYEDA